jgi:hypothetical protein
MYRSLVFFLALPLFGCSSDIVAKVEAFADRVCACKDEACALGVQKDYLEWYQSNKGAKGSEKERKGLQDALRRYAECHGRLVTEVAPAPPTPTPEPKAPAPTAPKAPAAAAPGAAPANSAGESAPAKAPEAKNSPSPAEAAKTGPQPPAPAAEGELKANPVKRAIPMPADLRKTRPGSDQPK